MLKLLAQTISAAIAFIASAIGASLELKDDDRVVFLGNSFFERALDHGHIETALALAWPDRTITYRNIGWDGDTVFGHSRAGGRRRAIFGNPAEGFARLTQHIHSLDPTVVFIAYGFNESFEGTDGVAAFREGLKALLGSIGKEGRRIVLLSPTPMELADRGHVEKHNKILAEYRDVIAASATENDHAFVDLFAALQGKRYSSNGVHPSDLGYRMIAGIISEQLSIPSPNISLRSEAAEAIRSAISKKNRLYFHRWRPRNDAFVYGERKDEQKIAQTEPEKFEPFIAKQEALIRELIAKTTP